MKAVIGTDGSDCAQVALDLAADLAWPEGSTLRVVEALWPPSRIEADDHGLPGEDDGLFTEAGSVVTAQARRLTAPGRKVEHAAVIGPPSTVLRNEANELGADLIVVGSRGRGSLATMLLGSVSAEVVDQAHRPVLVARSRTIRRVMLAVDGSDAAYGAECVAADWPIFAGVPIDVVSVAHHEPVWDGVFVSELANPSGTGMTILHESRRHHLSIATAAAQRLAIKGRSAEPLIPAGDPAAELTRVAQEHHADLVVLGTRGNTGVRRLVVGSVARHVLLHAHCSVLVVPQSV